MLKMCDQPPPYDNSRLDSKTGSGNVQQWSFADQVTVSRSQHVAAAASKVQEMLEARARYGIAGAMLLLIPGGQLDLSKSQKAVELDDTEYICLELAGEADTVEFWSQRQAVQELKSRVTDSLGGGAHSKLVHAAVLLEEYHFRSESAFGLMETTAATCIVIELKV